jgi:chromosome segregation ATPase
MGIDSKQAYVRDRYVRLHGYYRHEIQPLEELRAEKDEQIGQLRLRLKRLECAAFRTADEVGDVNNAAVAAALELERIQNALQSTQAEYEAARIKKGDLLAEISGLRADLAEANHAIDEGRNQRSLCLAEMHRLEKERDAGEKIWKMIRMFKNGGLAVEFDKKMQEHERLEKEIGAMEGRLGDVQMEDESVHKSP